MKAGKVSENVLKRSILKQLETRRSEILKGACHGEDCAVLAWDEGMKTAVSTGTCPGACAGQGALALYNATNNLAASGAEPVGVFVTILLPVDTQEDILKEIIKDIESAAAGINVQVCGGHTGITDAVNRPVVTVTAVGKLLWEKAGSARPGNDLVIAGHIGLEGTAILAREYEEELKKRFPAKMIYDAIQYDRRLSVVHEAAPAVKSGVTAMHDAHEGGIFGALWEMAEASHVGLEVDLKKIPVKQETIEICNFFDINPYGLLSSGALLLASEDGNRLVMDLEAAGIDAVVIGKITDSNDRVIINGENRRFLEPSKTDEIFKIKEIER